MGNPDRGVHARDRPGAKSMPPSPSEMVRRRRTLRAASTSLTPNLPSQDSSDWGIVLVILSLSSQIGKGLQKEGVKGLPELSLESAPQYLRKKVWVLGLALDIGGAVFGLVALGLLPISIFQPLSCSGLVVLALFSYFYLKERLGWLEWLGIALSLAGIVALSFTLVPVDYALLPLGWLQIKMGITMGAVAGFVVVLELMAIKAKRAPANVVMVELLSGTQAGLCIGAGNAGLGSGLQFVMAGSGLTRVIAGGFVALGICFTGASPVFANRGYSVGRVVIITAYMTLVSLAAGVLIGTLVLDEPWPTEFLLSAMRFAALITIALSVLLLNASEVAKACCAEGGDDADPSVPYQRAPSDTDAVVVPSDA